MASHMLVSLSCVDLVSCYHTESFLLIRHPFYLVFLCSFLNSFLHFEYFQPLPHVSN